MLPYLVRMPAAPAQRPAVVAILAALAVLLSGCVTQGDREPGSDVSGVSEVQETSEPDRYVAMGDSYTAAPPRPMPEQVKGCMRSKENYPRLVAAELENTELVDVSCSGASTVSIFSKQAFEHGDAVRPPQLDALTEDTDLVTVGIGANDFRLFNSMIFKCLDLASQDPDGAPCMEHHTRGGKDRLERTIDRIQPRVEQVVRRIRKRAPEARVLVVGYPQLVPDAGDCPRRLPMAEGDYAYAQRINRQLAEAVRDGGLAAGAEYVDLFSASQGHDICSDEPWIAGIRGAKARDAMGLHPYPVEQEAVAELVLDRLGVVS